MNRTVLDQPNSLAVLPLSACAIALSIAFCIAVSTNTLAAEPPADKGAEKEVSAVKDAAKKEAGKKKSAKQDKQKSSGKATDWKTLKGSWVVSQFGGDGPVEMKDGLVQMGFGDPLTGIRWEGDLYRENYEIALEARRTDGFDFFCGLTFPVGNDHISFILGGWGGGVVGISSIDGRDASENDTTSFQNFENNRWYKVRVRVEPNKITCWIDDKVACDHAREGHEFDIRYEMDQCVPMGVAAFQCKSELRNLRIRKLTKKEIAAASKESSDTTDKP